MKFDKKLATIVTDTESATAYFADGSSVVAKLIVGCDGSRSIVRQIMVGDTKLSDSVQSDYTILNFPCSYSATISEQLRDIHPVFKVAYHPKQPMMYLLAMADASPEDAASHTHQNLISWTGPPYAADLVTTQSRLERLREIGPIWAHPWGTAAMNVSEDTVTHADCGSHWDPRSVFKCANGKTTWNGNDWKGHITLAGDAAHTMMPRREVSRCLVHVLTFLDRGQGLNNALQDAAELLKQLKAVLKDKSTDLAKAIAMYEEEMVARGGAEVEMTGKQAMAAHNWEMLMQSPMFKHGANKAK